MTGVVVASLLLSPESAAVVVIVVVVVDVATVLLNPSVHVNHFKVACLLVRGDKMLRDVISDSGV